MNELREHSIWWDALKLYSDGMLRELWSLTDEEEPLKRYNPAQPRVPRGHPDGGQWTQVDMSGPASPALSPMPLEDDAIEPVYPIESLLLLLPTAKLLSNSLEAFGGFLAGFSRLSPQQLQNLKRFERSLPKKAKATKIINLQGRNKISQSDVPSNHIPGSFARYEKLVDKSGRTLKYTKTTYGPNGNVIHTKTKFETIPK